MLFIARLIGQEMNAVIGWRFLTGWQTAGGLYTEWDCERNHVDVERRLDTVMARGARQYALLHLTSYAPSITTSSLKDIRIYLSLTSILRRLDKF